MKTTALLATAATTLAALPLAASVNPQSEIRNPKSAAPSPQPNIIYILADDLGYGDLGCYGQKKIETPNLDALAARGKRFTQFYTGSPVSAPSRCITFTGLHSGHSYIRGNDEMASRGDVWNHAAMLANPYLEGQRPLPAGTITFPHLLQKAGYATACVGKWGLGYPGSESTPNKMGFDFFYGYNCQRQAHTYYPPFLYRNDQRETLPNKLLPPSATPLDEGADPRDEKSYAKYTQQAYAPDLMLTEILTFIERTTRPGTASVPPADAPQARQTRNSELGTRNSAGGSAAVPLPGISLRPAFTGATPQRPEPLFWEHEGNRAVRDGRWKLVAKGARGAWELYDMEADRSELNNLAEKHKDTVARLSAAWQKWAVSANVLPWPWADNKTGKVTRQTKKATTVPREDEEGG